MPAPSTSTLALRGRPESAGRVPAGPAIKSHAESAVITSDEPPTAPRWPRNRRRVGTEREREDGVEFMLCSKSAFEDDIWRHSSYRIGCLTHFPTLMALCSEGTSYLP